MKDNLDIEKLFKDKFESFEPTVSAKVWQGIASSVGTVGATSTAAGMSAWVKGLIIGVAATGVGIMAWTYSGDDSTIPNKNTSIEVQTDVNNQDIEISNTPITNDAASKISDGAENKEPTNTALTAKTNTIERDNVAAKDEVVNQAQVSDKLGKSSQGSSQADPNQLTTKNNSANIVADKKTTAKAKMFDENTVVSRPNSDKVNDAPKKAADLAADIAVKQDIDDPTEVISTADKSSFNKIPNIFTPNNDRRNDEFFIECENIKEFYIVIFTKQNMKVYESTDTEFRWGGFDMSGNKVPVGDYNYLIKAVGEDDKPHSIYGQLSIR